MNEDLGDLGLNSGGVGVGVFGGVGVEDGIVSLDQQANDAPHDAPPGVPGLARDIISISDSALSDFWRRELCICILQQASRC